MPSTFHSLIISKISINRSQCFISGMRNCTIEREQFRNLVEVALFPEISAPLKTSTFGKGWIATSYLHWDGRQSCKIGPPHKSTVEAGILDSFGNSSEFKETKLLTFLCCFWFGQKILILHIIKQSRVFYGRWKAPQSDGVENTDNTWKNAEEHLTNWCKRCVRHDWPTPPSVTRAETDPLDCKLQHNCNCTTWATQVIVWNILGT